MSWPRHIDNPNRGMPGVRRGVVRELEVALSHGLDAIIDFVWRHSIPEPNSGCWLWLGPVNNHGYAYMCDPRQPIDRVRPHRVFIHRVVCEATYGKMEPEVQTRHLCHVTGCVNPMHLLPGTRSENLMDSVRDGRWTFTRGEGNGRAKLSLADVREIRATSKGSLVAPLVQKFGVSAGLIRQIRRGAIWGTELCFVVLLASAAVAAPPPDSNGELHDWFQGLRQPGTSLSCCSIADCRPTEWRHAGTGYEAKVNGAWQSVPDEFVLHGHDNPTGNGIVCYTPSRGIMCFIKGPET